MNSTRRTPCRICNQRTQEGKQANREQSCPHLGVLERLRARDLVGRCLRPRWPLAPGTSRRSARSESGAAWPPGAPRPRSRCCPPRPPTRSCRPDGRGPPCPAALQLVVILLSRGHPPPLHGWRLPHASRHSRAVASIRSRDERTGQGQGNPPAKLSGCGG